MLLRPLGASACACLAACLLACGGGRFGAGDSVPRGPLPRSVRPQHVTLDLEIVPERDGFAGTAVIRLQLQRALDTIWLHGRDLDVSEVTLREGDGDPIPGRWLTRDPAGVVAVRLPRPVGPGPATLRVVYRARFGRTLRGLYRVDSGGDAYAFTQFEPIAARRAFPGFDEPAFKTPFDVALTVPAESEVIATTPAVEEQALPGGLVRVRFATTPPLPTYLLAWAVGPLDVVAAAPLDAPDRRIPFRGAAARGRGDRLAYGLEHTPPLLAALEDYFGIPYPFAKLDVIAVPDFGAGAMENVGAITFRESLLLLDAESAPEQQRRSFAYVMAHELAHQWFGNLVTLAWWDDLWLNEAFATWMGFRTVRSVFPEQQAELAALETVHRAMAADSLASARRIRQPIETHHDIRNAFDAITYSKGGGVLRMFERWLGEARFRDGIRRYLNAHRDGVATSADLLAALSKAAGRDVARPFHSFLDQPGVPLLATELRCDRDGAELRLRQSRYLPVGSEASPDGLWQVPVCARYGAGGEVREACTLLTEREGTLPLESRACPRWVMPNADAAGYYRWSAETADTERLQAEGLSHLSTGERLALADSLAAALHAGAQPAAEVYPALARLADDAERSVATAPMPLLRLAHQRLVSDDLRPAVERFAHALYAPRYRRLGWETAPGESGETRLLRKAVIEFLAKVARDPEVRREAARRGRRYVGIDGAEPDPEAVDPDLVGVALSVAVQDGDAAFFAALLARFRDSQDALERSRLLGALGSTRDPALAERARALALDPDVRLNEALVPLFTQMQEPSMRGPTWAWTESHFDAVTARIGSDRAAHTPWLAASFCDVARAEQVERFLTPRIDALDGGPRNLRGALERIRLCAALVDAQAASARSFFSTNPGRGVGR